MKKVTKKILAFVLSLALVAAVLPSNVTADQGIQVSDAAALKDALANGGVVTLASDITAEDTGFVVDKDVTLNLNNCSVSVPNDAAGDGVFHVINGATLTINGEGSVDGESPYNEYDMAIWADGGHVVINGGTYSNQGAGEDDHYDLIYAKNGGIITINGGTFISHTPKWTLNQHDSTAGKIVVYGGVFYEYNPGDAYSEPTQPLSFLAPCHKAVESVAEDVVVYTVEESHAYGAWQPFDSEQHVRYCQDNAEHAEYAPHEFGAWEVVTPATKEQTGLETRECTVCNAVEEHIIPVLAGEWKSNSVGRWFEYNDGSYPVGKWELIEGEWYAFDMAGYARTGWFLSGSTWHYLDPETCAMMTDWQKIGSKWYYLDPESGAMKKGWILLDDIWYYLHPINGDMLTGWQKIGGSWYYMNGSGAMLTGWQIIGIHWYYLHPTNGNMMTGWISDNGKWYYCESSGAMAMSRWVGNYYVGASGAMLTATWIGDFYVDESGKWVPNKGKSTAGIWYEDEVGKWFCYASGQCAYNAWILLDGEWYYAGDDGYIVTGWKYIGEYWYYFTANGALDQDLRDVYSSGPYQIRVNRAKCVITIFAKDSVTGQFNIPIKAFICSVGCPWSPTITGTFRTPAKYSYKQLNGPTWAKWCTRINRGYLFHSMPSPTSSPYQILPEKYNLLGQYASQGCIRMTVGDAKWIYDKCALGTVVKISDSEPTPFDKPVVPKIYSVTSVDPAGDTY